MPAREIDVAEVTRVVEQLCLDANYVAADDVRQAFELAAEREVSPLGKQVLTQLLENMRVAASERVPMCQDTGTVVLFAEIGQDVRFTGGLFSEAVNDGVRRAYTGGYLRASIVGRPVG